MDHDNDERRPEPSARHRPAPDEPPPPPIDRAIGVATTHLADAEEEFVETLPAASVDKADTVVRRAEDLEALAEDGRDGARRKGD
jgi:hypothetical protein